MLQRSVELGRAEQCGCHCRFWCQELEDRGLCCTKAKAPVGERVARRSSKEKLY
jgi:hypothetical protein